MRAGVIPLGTVAVLFLLAAWGVPRLTDYVAHVGRYRRYRRSYPAADRGRVWRHTR